MSGLTFRRSGCYFEDLRTDEDKGNAQLSPSPFSHLQLRDSPSSENAGSVRQHLHHALNQLPTHQLNQVRTFLDHFIGEPTANCAVKFASDRSEASKRRLRERLIKLRVTGQVKTSGAWARVGDFRVDPDQGKSSGRHEYTWYEDKSLVVHRMILHDSIQIDVVERLTFVENERKLLFVQVIYAGGRIVSRKEEFQMEDSTRPNVELQGTEIDLVNYSANVAVPVRI